MSKRIISTVLAILMAFSLVACQKTDKTDTTTPPETTSHIESSPVPQPELFTEPVEETTEAEPEPEVEVEVEETEPETKPLVIQTENIGGFDFSGSKNKLNEEKESSSGQDIGMKEKNVFAGNVLYDGEDFTITMSEMMGGLLYEGYFMVENKTGREIYNKNTEVSLNDSNIRDPYAVFNGYAVNYSIMRQTGYVTENDNVSCWGIVFNTKYFRAFGQEYIYDIDTLTFSVVFYDQETDEEVFNQTFTIENPDYDKDAHPIPSVKTFKNNKNSITYVGTATEENVYRVGEGAYAAAPNGMPAAFLMVLENNNDQDAYVYAPANVKINNKIVCESTGMDGRIPAGCKVLKFIELKATDENTEIPEFDKIKTLTFDEIFTYDWNPEVEATVKNCSVKVNANTAAQILNIPKTPDVIEPEDMVASEKTN